MPSADLVQRKGWGLALWARQLGGDLHSPETDGGDAAVPQRRRWMHSATRWRRSPATRTDLLARRELHCCAQAEAGQRRFAFVNRRSKSVTIGVNQLVLRNIPLRRRFDSGRDAALRRIPEEQRPRWGARTSNPVGGGLLSPVGSTPSSSANPAAEWNSSARSPANVWLQ